MSVEHDGYDGRDARDARDEPYDALEHEPDLDPLLAVLMDEPPSGPARADAAYLAEYAEASADVRVLREQLGLIADALTAPEPEPVPEAPRLAPPRPRRSRLAVAVGVLAAACAALMVAGLGWLAVVGGPYGADDSVSSGSAADEGAQKDARVSEAAADPTYLACMDLVAEGEITAVRALSGAAAGRERITLEVGTFYKPAGEDEPRLVFERDRGTEPALGVGDRALIAVPSGGADADVLAVGEPDVRWAAAEVADALAGPSAPPCE
ncbi:hypothetical protein AB0D49_34660 [Streptomyces sp. NPDC048290]|uniref:hypothetical protein n=1 Tax=Streptomyces sp. NPDC048290 TaxID=3155811 RepID=UPI003445304B